MKERRFQLSSGKEKIRKVGRSDGHLKMEHFFIPAPFRRQPIGGEPVEEGRSVHILVLTSQIFTAQRNAGFHRPGLAIISLQI
jgi:hypothetical protein